MATALSQRETTHETTPLTVTGATVAGIGAGVGTAAVGTKIANGELKFDDTKNAVVDFVRNGADKAKDAASHVAESVKGAVGKTNNTEVLSENGEKVAEAAKEATQSFKDKASGVFDGLKGSVKGLKQSFDGIEDPKVKAAIIATAAIATLATAKVAHDKLSETTINPQTDKVSSTSKGAAKTSELAV